MPSTAANAIIRSVNLALAELHHLRAQLALRWTHGSLHRVFDLCINEEGVCFAEDVFNCNLGAVETLCFGCCNFGGKVVTQVLVNNAVRGSKEPSTWEMKWCSLSVSLFQSAMSAVRSISSAVQKDAWAFLYIFQMSAWHMGKRMIWCGFSCRSGSGASSPLFLVVL